MATPFERLDTMTTYLSLPYSGNPSAMVSMHQFHFNLPDRRLRQAPSTDQINIVCSRVLPALPIASSPLESAIPSTEMVQHPSMW